MASILNPLHRELLFLRDKPHVLERALTSQLPHSPSLLFAGDSHVGCGIDPNEIEGAFNFAANGESYVQVESKVTNYFERAGHPAALVLPIDAHSFSSYFVRRIQYPRYWSMRMRPSQFIEATDTWTEAGAWFRGRYLHWLGRGDLLFRDLQRVAAHGPRRRPQGGFTPRTTTMSALSEPDRRARVDRPWNKHFRGQDVEDPLPVAAFRRLLRRCEQEGVPVVLIRFPVTAEYAQRIPDEALRAAKRHAQWAIDQHLAIAVLDHHDWRSSDLTAFHDGDHLVDSAAREFSRVVGSEIRTLLAPR